jgi:hypothetical protein
MTLIPKINWKVLLRCRIFLLCPPMRDGRTGVTIMTTISTTPGSSVIKGTRHAGLDRMTAGAELLSRLLTAAIRGLDAWRDARIASHNDAVIAALASQDPRVLADLRAAADRNRRG